MQAADSGPYAKRAPEPTPERASTNFIAITTLAVLRSRATA